MSHVEIEPGVGISTKETPDNPHTKGALKIKGSIRLFTNDNGEPEALIY